MVKGDRLSTLGPADGEAGKLHHGTTPIFSKLGRCGKKLETADRSRAFQSKLYEWTPNLLKNRSPYKNNYTGIV